MSVFTIFMICWCSGLVLFPSGSIISEKIRNYDGNGTAAGRKAELSRKETIFLNDLNKKELFTLEGDYSESHVVEHEGATYLVYLDKIEKNKIYMCAEKLNLEFPAPEN